MVAVRSAGLAFESIIGVVVDEVPNPSDASMEDRETDRVGRKEVVKALVDERYLEMLVGIANERFAANTERIKRFEETLFGGKSIKEHDWEDKKARQERKRKEGLRRREELKVERNGRDNSVEGIHGEKDIIIGDLEGNT